MWQPPSHVGGSAHSLQVHEFPCQYIYVALFFRRETTTSPSHRLATITMSAEAEEKKTFSDSDKGAEGIEEQAPPEKPGAFDAVFGSGYNVIEVRFTILAAILVALNNGMVNGICLSGFISENPPTDLDPAKAMVSGVAAYVTNSATYLIDEGWDLYRFNLGMFLSYMIGSGIPGLLSPTAKPYSIDPMFGPAFMLGGTFLLASSFFSIYDQQTRWIYFFAIAANGVQNGVASIYSANLIRCTLTGATTDIGLVIGNAMRGNYDKAPKACVLATIIICFWVGGLLAFPLVRAWEAQTLFFNAAIFYSVGILNIIYLVGHLKLSLVEAITGVWDWKDVLNKIKPEGSKEEFLAFFDELDHDKGGTLDMHELEKGLRGKVTEEELHALLIAADADGSGDIDKQEWADLVEELYKVDEDVASGHRSSWFSKEKPERQPGSTGMP